MRNRRAVRARVGAVVDFLHPACRQVRVNLRGAQALVAKKLLDAAQVGAVVEQMGGEAVAERMGADARIEAGLHQILVELAADGARAERFAVLVEKDAVGLGAMRFAVDGAQLGVALHGFDRLAAEWREAIFAALAADAQGSFVRSPVADFQLVQLPCTYSP